MNNEYFLPIDSQKHIAWAALKNYVRALLQSNDREAIAELRNNLIDFAGALRKHGKKA